MLLFAVLKHFCYSNFERRPSEDDLGDHFWLISEAVKRDEVLANSKVCSHHC